MRPSRLASALLAVALPVATHAAGCDAQLRKHLASKRAHAFEAFDQDDHPGWRPLADAGCEAEATTLISAYAAKQAHPHPVLAWHRAQMLAGAGRTSEAVAAARSTLHPAGSDDASGFDRNDHVNAMIAFLQGDQRALQANRDRLAEAVAKTERNQPNLRSANRLLRCFGQAYKIAHSCPTTP